MTRQIFVWADVPDRASTGRGGPPCWSINVHWDRTGINGVHHVEILRTDVTLHTLPQPVRKRDSRGPIPNDIFTDEDRGLRDNHSYVYTVKLWNGGSQPLASGPSDQDGQDISPQCNGPGQNNAFVMLTSGSSDVLVPRGADINDYTHEEGSILEGKWQHAHTLNPAKDDAHRHAISVSLVQSTSGKLQAVARVTPSQDNEGDILVAYETDPGVDWQGPVTLTADDGPINHVTGTPALIQDHQDAFELLVPRGSDLDHYVQDKESFLEGKWVHVHTLKPPADDAQAQFKSVSFVQSSSGTLVAIARLSTAAGAGGEYLVAYELKPAAGSVDEPGSEAEEVSESESVTVSVSEDAEVISVSETVTVSISESVSGPESTPDPALDWQGPVKLVADNGGSIQVSGSTAMIQSDLGDFELLVPRGAFIDQYTQEEATVLKGFWKHVQTLPSPDNNAQITANWLIQNRSGKFQAIARVAPPSGGGDDYLVGYESDPGAQWQGPVKLVADDGPILAGEPQVVIG